MTGKRLLPKRSADKPNATPLTLTAPPQNTQAEEEPPPSSSDWGIITDDTTPAVSSSAPIDPSSKKPATSHADDHPPSQSGNNQTHTVVSSLKDYGDSLVPPPRSFDKKSTTPVPSTGRELLNNTLLDGRYLITKVLGGGGMGAVYEGEQVHNGQVIAVKVLPFRMTDSKESLRRFQREAELTAALMDANVCRIYDFGTLEDGRPYYVMERLQGVSLADRLADGPPIPILNSVEIIMQVLSGLRAAHRAGIVHRDVKPANIFLHERADNRIQVKLLDFGVAKRLSSLLEPGGGEETTQLTKTGFVMGTPFYLSPEQLEGERHLDLRVDIWAVGVVLYETITGKRPFSGSNFPELMEQIMNGTPAPMSEVRRDVPLLLQRIVNRAMAKKRSERYESALQFLRELQTIRIPLLRQKEQHD